MKCWFWKRIVELYGIWKCAPHWWRMHIFTWKSFANCLRMCTWVSLSSEWIQARNRFRIGLSLCEVAIFWEEKSTTIHFSKSNLQKLWKPKNSCFVLLTKKNILPVRGRKCVRAKTFLPIEQLMHLATFYILWTFSYYLNS